MRSNLSVFQVTALFVIPVYFSFEVVWDVFSLLTQMLLRLSNQLERSNHTVRMMRRRTSFVSLLLMISQCHSFHSIVNPCRFNQFNWEFYSNVDFAGAIGKTMLSVWCGMNVLRRFTPIILLMTQFQWLQYSILHGLDSLLMVSTTISVWVRCLLFNQLICHELLSNVFVWIGDAQIHNSYNATRVLFNPDIKEVNEYIANFWCWTYVCVLLDVNSL